MISLLLAAGSRSDICTGGGGSAVNSPTGMARKKRMVRELVDIFHLLQVP
jgi:hypothetical protein